MTSDAERLLARIAALEATVRTLEEQLRADGSADERSAADSDELRLANERIILAGLRAQEDAASAEREFTQLNALLSGLAEGVIVCDSAGDVLLANRAASDIVGPAASRFFPGPDTPFRLQRLDGMTLPHAEWPLPRVLGGEEFADEECVLLAGVQAPRRISFSANAVRNLNGHVALAIVTCRDVTELRRLEQMRQEYAALISHDLRAPLTTILGHGQRLRRRSVEVADADAVNSADAIVTSAGRMNVMIQDLLESSYLESSTFKVTRAPIDPAAHVASVISRLDESDQKRFSIGSEPIDPVYADAELFERVIGNLLTNAGKYSPPETPVHVRVQAVADEVRISVTDEGIGISPEDNDHLFDRYYRSKAAAAGRSGYGLGLYIARLIMEAHGGRIWVESELGRGSTFVVAFPRV
jgi:signal transduction histidine kinase